MNQEVIRTSYTRFVFIILLLLLLTAVVATPIGGTAVAEANTSGMASQVMVTEQTADDFPTMAQTIVGDDQAEQLLYDFDSTYGSGSELLGNFWSG